jgi:hypothetical protein
MFFSLWYVVPRKIWQPWLAAMGQWKNGFEFQKLEHVFA